MGGYKHRDPVPVREMDKSRYDGHHTICQTLRDIYHLAEFPPGNDPAEWPADYAASEAIRLKCRVAMAMAKAMHEKLKEYRERT